MKVCRRPPETDTERQEQDAQENRRIRAAENWLRHGQERQTRQKDDAQLKGDDERPAGCRSEIEFACFGLRPGAPGEGHTEAPRNTNDAGYQG